MPLSSSNLTVVIYTMWSLFSIFLASRYSSDGFFLFLFSSMISSVVTLFVNQMFCLTLCICPIVVWINFGRCFRTLAAVSPGNDVNQLLLIAQINVVTTGVPNEV